MNQIYHGISHPLIICCIWDAIMASKILILRNIMQAILQRLIVLLNIQ